ncbi:MAG TPA: insulinase family protein, partial [Pseudolabrys sp.]|nr:insulinase family protein [Pseudolabrys sp.]
SWTDRIRAVTGEQVQAAAKQWLEKQRSVTGYLVKDKSPQVEKRS